MYSHEQKALKKISHILMNRYPKEIEKIIAFGSRVRGDHREGSDFDVLVVTKNRTPLIEEGIIDVFVEEEMESGISFDPVIKTAHSYQMEKQYNTPFYNHIIQEGVKI